jgi:Relaxase/Mobilisation nuclease domain
MTRQSIQSVKTIVQRRLYHCSLSLPTGEQLDDQSWRDLTQDYLTAMGFAGHQYLVVRHTDTPSHDHVHVVVNRVAINGEVTPDNWDAYRAQVVTQALESAYGLTPTKTSWETKRTMLSKRQLEKEKTTGVPSIQRQLQDEIEAVIPLSENFTDWVDRLHNRDITIKVNYGHANQPIGLSYGKDGVTMSGSSLGRGYSWEGIQQAIGSEALETHAPDQIAATRNDITAHLDRANGDETLPALIERLHHNGIEAYVRYKRLKGGKQQAEAISFRQGPIAFPGESLGSEYHLKGLQESSRVDYQPDRDDAWIRHWQAYQAGASQPPGASPKKSQTFEKKVVPKTITQLEPHQVYVFGSSLDGIHGTGRALDAFGREARQQRKSGELDVKIGQWAIWGQGQGYQEGADGNGYAIATKQKWTSKKSLPMATIEQQVDQLIEFAQAHPEQEFLFSRFQDKAMVKIWHDRAVPENVRLPESWLKHLKPLVEIIEMPLKRQRRVVISGDVGAKFDQRTRDIAIGQVIRGVEAAFREAQTQGVDRIQFVSGLMPGIEYWGAVAALRLREQQVNHKIPAVPKIEVVAAVTELEAIQRWDKKTINQYQRVIAACDRVESNRDIDYLVTADDLLLLVEMQRREEDSRLQHEALVRNIPIHRYAVDPGMNRQHQQR